MSIRRNKTVIENNLLTIMEKLATLLNQTLECYIKINNSSISKGDLKLLDMKMGEVKTLTEMMIR